MKRVERRGIISKVAFILGARDARYGFKNSQIEIQRKLEEIEKLEIESRDIRPSDELLKKSVSAIKETHLKKIQRLKNEITVARASYMAGGEIAMLHPNENHYELLSEYLGGSESKEELQREIEQFYKEKRTIKKPQVKEITTYSPSTKEDELKEKLKLLAKIIGLIALLRFASYIEENTIKNNDPERAPIQETIDKHSNFRKHMSGDSWKFTQDDGTTYTYSMPQSYYDRQQDGR